MASNIITSDGKDLDDRYLGKSSPATSVHWNNVQGKPSLATTRLVSDPIATPFNVSSGSTATYTVPRDGYVYWTLGGNECGTNAYTQTDAYVGNTKIGSRGYGQNTWSVSGEGFLLSGTVLKVRAVRVSGSNQTISGRIVSYRFA